MSIVQHLKRALGFSVTDEEFEEEMASEELTSTGGSHRSVEIINPFRPEPAPQPAPRADDGEWRDERRRLLDEIDRLKAGTATVDDLKKELTAVKLSADRQRRALTDRANDLETQLEHSQRENERLQTENRKNLSRLRSAGVKVDTTLVDADPIVADLRSALAAAEKDRDIWKLDADKALRKLELAEALNEDLRSRLNQSKKELKVVQELNDAGARDTHRVDDLERRLREATERAVSLESELDSQRQTLAHNLETAEKREVELKSEVARLKLKLEQKTARETKSRHGSRKKKQPKPAASPDASPNSSNSASPDSEALDDWFVSVPSSASSKSPSSPKSPSKPSASKPSSTPSKPTDDRQLSLF